MLADALIVGDAENAPKEAFEEDSYFKGTIQDLQINGKSVALFEPVANITTLGVQIVKRNILKVRYYSFCVNSEGSEV